MTQPSPRRTRRPSAKTATARPRLPRSVQLAVDAAVGKKALDLVVLDLRKSDAFTDFFVIATGANQRQVHAIADGVEMGLKGEGVRPSNVEGSKKAEWVLVDYFDFVVHVFSPAARAFYGLERLWGTARHIPIDNPPVEA
jgi:ribosome-associated protein